MATQCKPICKIIRHILNSDGQILQAVSPWPEGLQGKPFPPPAEYEKRIQMLGQKYVGFPQADPKITMKDAISRSMGATAAEQLVVYYVRR